MDEKIQRTFNNFKNKRVGVFCDDSNLFYAYKKSGWRIDYKKLKKLLEKYCDLKFINYYIAVPDKDDPSRANTEKFLLKLRDYVILKKKDLKYIPNGKGVIKKGDVDINVTLDVVRSISELDLVIVLSGDSDYLELKNYVARDMKKEIIFMGYKDNMAWELKQYCRIIFLDKIKELIAL